MTEAVDFDCNELRRVLRWKHNNMVRQRAPIEQKIERSQGLVFWFHVWRLNRLNAKIEEVAYLINEFERSA